jgi:uncharacterized protein DUF6677
MANPQSTATLGRNDKSQALSTMNPTVVTIVAWLVPGLGHLIQRRYIRGLLIMAAIFIMFFAGLGMQGKVYSFNTGDLLDILGFIGDIGAGLLYVIARMMNWGLGNIHRAVADYGTKYIVVAGLLNIVATVDAYHIAIGKKQ